MTAAAAIRDHTRLELHALHVERDGRGEVHQVGRVDTGVFVEMPPEGVDLIEWIGEGLPLGDIRARFCARHGEPPDVEDFIATLTELGFVESVDGQVLEQDAPDPPRGWRPLLRIDAPKLAWARSRPAVAVWTLMAAIGWIGVPLWFVLFPSAWPTPSSAWIGGDVSVSLNFAVLSVVGWTLVLVHEMTHVLSMRALGQDCSLTLGHRLYFVVIQSDVSAARALPRRMRFLPYLSGMTWDLNVLLVCLVLHATVLPISVLGAVIYMTTMGLLFQCAFFMRTDMYYVLTNWLRLGNLMEEMRQWLANAGRRLIGDRPRNDLSEVPERELRLVRWYAAFCALSFVALSWVAFVIYLPMLSKFVLGTSHGLAAGPTHAEFWDASAFLAVTLGYFVVLIAVSIRDVRRRRGAGPESAARLLGSRGAG